ncbi:MFS transporter [Francisella sp. Scap27]|uniref:MFS transporter n=1 Tax=Francisella sp. Scap27 TaxID=2589986 RepID=UPI0015BED0D2|nr:MFS transporter [Francisella sp. Scap27]QLE78275.1 MFS transporter [Francisella sp. Scap27]
MLKKYINNIGFCLGVVGLIVFMFGLVETNIDNKNLFILLATFILLISAVIQGEVFFIGSQSIAWITAVMTFFEIGQNYIIIAFILLVTIFALGYFFKNKLLFSNACAFVGLIALCLGIALGMNEPMVICGLFLAIYACFSIKDGYSIGWVFLVLNLVFAVVAINSLYAFY